MILALCTLLLSTATAKEYVYSGDTNVLAIPLEDSIDDFALRIEAIKRAKVSIDIFTYMQTLDDKLGEEYNQAIEGAIRRGVKVRFAMDWLPNTAALGINASEPVDRMLREAFSSESCTDLQVQCITPLTKVLSGFTPTDNFHEKMLNIDTGTENEIAWITGRNNNDYAVRDLDFAVALRRIDPNKKSVISLLDQVFADTWDETLRMQDPKSKKAGKNKPKKTIHTPLELRTSSLFPGLKAALFDRKEIPGTTFKPQTLSITTNSFFPQLRANSWLTISRDEKMKSDNIDAVVRGIHLAKVVRMSLMSTFWPDQIKAALLLAVKRGVKIEIFTNSETSDKIAVPGALSFLYSSRDLSDLMNAVNEQNKLVDQPKAELKINVLDVSQTQKIPQFWKRIKFVHQKMIITDNEIFMGSDNYNKASMMKNSEMQVRMTGKDALHFFHCHLDDISQLFIPLTEDQLRAAKMKSLTPQNRIAIKALRPFF